MTIWNKIYNVRRRESISFRESEEEGPEFRQHLRDTKNYTLFMVQFVFGGKSFLSSPSSSAFFALVRAYASIPFSLNCCVPFLTVDKHTHTHTNEKWLHNYFKQTCRWTATKSGQKLPHNYLVDIFVFVVVAFCWSAFMNFIGGDTYLVGNAQVWKFMHVVRYLLETIFFLQQCCIISGKKVVQQQNPTTFSSCCSEWSCRLANFGLFDFACVRKSLNRVSVNL